MKKITCLIASLFVATSAFAQIGLTTFSYSQNFDTLATSATNVTSNPWTNNSTLPGWYLFNSAGNAMATYGSGQGDSNSGAFYSFGSASSSERALGGTASGGTIFGSPAAGAVAGHIAVGFTNNTGIELATFTLDFVGEQWRNGGNATPQTMILEYGFGATFATVSAWTAPGGNFDFISPIATATASAVDGNSAGLVQGLGGTVNASWLVGQTLWVRWIEFNDIGNDHGMAIDNFNISVGAAIPEPSTYAAIFGFVVFLGVAGRRYFRN